MTCNLPFVLVPLLMPEFNSGQIANSHGSIQRTQVQQFMFVWEALLSQSYHHYHHNHYFNHHLVIMIIISTIIIIIGTWLSILTMQFYCLLDLNIGLLFLG